MTVTARAEPAKTDLHGIALGMTTEQAMAAAALPCSKLPYSSDIACKEATDESDYNASFSAGTPSVVLTVAHSFCSHEAPPAILGRLLGEFHVSQTRAEPDPNGFHVDLDPKTEAILNADDGTCPAGAGQALRSVAAQQCPDHDGIEPRRRPRQEGAQIVGRWVSRACRDAGLCCGRKRGPYRRAAKEAAHP